MSIPRNAINSFARLTLPSVESWGNNMNILRDPPRSIHTRRIDKVFDTTEINNSIDDSGNRAAEFINVYARGVNPCVSVNYSNLTAATNTGLTQAGDHAQASLPYKLTDSFRPPIRSQFDLLPLSRLPRNWTDAFSKPCFVDYSKQRASCGTAKDYRQVKNNTLKASTIPTAVYSIGTPAVDAPKSMNNRVKDVTIRSSCSAPVSNIIMGASTTRDARPNIRDCTKSYLLSHSSCQAPSSSSVAKKSMILSNPNFNLPRNVPSHSQYSNTSGCGVTSENPVSRNYVLKPNVRMQGPEGGFGIPLKVS